MRLRILIGAVALIAGCATLSEPSPNIPRDHFPLRHFALRRFDRVDDKVYRSGQPSPEELRELVARYGIRSVLKLNAGADEAPPDVTVLHHPLNVLLAPTQEELEAILVDIEKSPKPLLIHCTHGEDRTGLVVALYRLRHGTSAATAYADMQQHGFHPYPGLIGAWQRRLAWPSVIGWVR